MLELNKLLNPNEPQNDIENNPNNKGGLVNNLFAQILSDQKGISE